MTASLFLNSLKIEVATTGAGRFIGKPPVVKKKNAKSLHSR
jgi:hypothetical protein